MIGNNHYQTDQSQYLSNCAFFTRLIPVSRKDYKRTILHYELWYLDDANKVDVFILGWGSAALLVRKKNMFSPHAMVFAVYNNLHRTHIAPSAPIVIIEADV